MSLKYNRQNKNGSWTLCGAYLEYRREGGRLSPSVWNELSKPSK